MGISIFDKLIGNLKLRLSLLFKAGDTKTTNQIAGGDIYNVMTVLDPSGQNPDLLAKNAQKLIKDKGPKVTDTHIEIVLGTYLGVVKSSERPGTRLHLDFAVINKADIPTVLQGAYIK